MEDLRKLILRFKKYNGSTIVNFRGLEPHYQDTYSRYKIASSFDKMSFNLNDICTRLTQTTVYGSLAQELFQAITKVDQIISDNDHQIVDLKKFLKLVNEISEVADDFYEELNNPSCKIYIL